ncbi:hypothetical protein ACH5RR_032738 [Cinchona calisaya]|uniref:Uncharacterized protein n=1 Tax=Cinchona calisaya TaxID=153742 RepID=A0ABD2YL00_9GENT
MDARQRSRPLDGQPFFPDQLIFEILTSLGQVPIEIQCSLKSLIKNPTTPATRVDYPGEGTPHDALILGSCNG